MPLIVVPTPVGNLEDMTLRGLRALREADAVACEDTRRTLGLLNHYEIRKPLVSYHRHNERERSEELLARLAAGETIALVSDAGTPGISDPGYLLIRKAVERGLPVDVLPGANALLPALLLSGIEPQPFLFVGFPADDKGRRTREEAWTKTPATLIFYIAPHDLRRELARLENALGDRRAAVVREISKFHQEAIRGTLSELADVAGERNLRGEMVLIVAGAKDEGKEEDAFSAAWESVAGQMKKAGISDKDIANVLFASYGIPRNRVKAFLLQFNANAGGNGK